MQGIILLTEIPITDLILALIPIIVTTGLLMSVICLMPGDIFGSSDKKQEKGSPFQRKDAADESLIHYMKRKFRW